MGRKGEPLVRDFVRVSGSESTGLPIEKRSSNFPDDARWVRRYRAFHPRPKLPRKGVLSDRRYNRGSCDQEYTNHLPSGQEGRPDPQGPVPLLKRDKNPGSSYKVMAPTNNHQRYQQSSWRWLLGYGLVLIGISLPLYLHREAYQGFRESLRFFSSRRRVNAYTASFGCCGFMVFVGPQGLQVILAPVPGEPRGFGRNDRSDCSCSAR